MDQELTLFLASVGLLMLYLIFCNDRDGYQAALEEVNTPLTLGRTLLYSCASAGLNPDQHYGIDLAALLLRTSARFGPDSVSIHHPS